MEAEERPMKLRKIEHNSSEIVQPHDASTGMQTEAASSKPFADSSADDIATHAVVSGKDERSDDETDQTLNGLLVATPPTSSQPLSKNQRKKIRKREEWEAGRDFRKEKRRQKIKERKTRQREEKHAAKHQQQTQGNGTSNSNPQSTAPHRTKRHVRIPIAIVIDCGFDDYMVEKEKISLGSQLTRSYSDNTKASFQSHLYVSSWGNYLKERFETVIQGHYKNWVNVTFTDQDFVDAAEMARQVMMNPVGRDRVKGGVAARMEGVFEKYAEAEKQRSKKQLEGKSKSVTNIPNEALRSEAGSQDGSPRQNDSNNTHDSTGAADAASFTIPDTAKDSIVYLTSESPHTLTKLLPYHTYIVGGIVDKNRHKGLCYKTACDHGVKTAKLPINEYMTMQSRSVLATNHVVEIMLKWLELGDWGEAFLRVVPSRKRGELKVNDDSKGKSTDEVEANEEADATADEEDEPLDDGVEEG